jgi:hypothetical protein
MRTILAIAVLLVATACQSGGGYDGPYPFGPVWVPPPVQAAPMYGPVISCGRVGTMVHCY